MVAKTKVKQKKLNLALQGGGSHGAFTWGVLDYLLEDERIGLCSISGTSAGALNAVILADGLKRGGRALAKEKLEDFWTAVSEMAQYSPVQRSFFDLWMGNWNVDYSPGYMFLETASHFLPPQVLNPFKINPLRSLLLELVDFESVRSCSDIQLFIGTTQVETGKARVFTREETSIDVLMASACLPYLFEAVKIDGKYYWDGGYSGNPPLFPIMTSCTCDDIVIVQINPIERHALPVTSTEIRNRIDEITFNQSLLKELRAIEFVQRLLSEGTIDKSKYRSMNVHVIENQDRLRPLGASSKMNTETSFLLHLKEIGRATAKGWLDKNFEYIGHSNSIDLKKMFS